MERPSVLVVDDREVDRKLLDRVLTLADYEVVIAGGGAEALELTRSRLFDAAIVDLRMPGMDGLELLRRLKRHDPAMDVVMMTAEQTLAEVKRLQGLLPICAYCKKIRDDANYWHQVDGYLSAHLDVQFTHGVCPACRESVRKGLERTSS